MKHSKAESEKRERWVIDRWKAAWRPLKEGENVPVAAISDQIFRKFDQRMRVPKLLELRTKAIQELRKEGHTVPDPPSRNSKGKGKNKSRTKGKGRWPESRMAPDDTSTPIASRARGVVPASARGVDKATHTGLPTMIRLGDLSPADAVGHVLNTLRQNGVVNVHVDSSGAGYVVIDTAP